MCDAAALRVAANDYELENIVMLAHLCSVRNAVMHGAIHCIAFAVTTFYLAGALNDLARMDGRGPYLWAPSERPAIWMMRILALVLAWIGFLWLIKQCERHMIPELRRIAAVGTVLSTFSLWSLGVGSTLFQAVDCMLAPVHGWPRTAMEMAGAILVCTGVLTGVVVPIVAGVFGLRWYYRMGNWSCASGCPECGYSLRGLPAGSGCPECGWMRTSKDHGE